MRSFKRFVFDKRSDGTVRGVNFLALIKYNGTNIQEIINAIKKANIGNIEVRPGDIGKRKQQTDFVKLVRGQDYEYLYLTDGDVVGIKKYEIIVYNADYVNSYFKVLGNTLEPKE